MNHFGLLALAALCACAGSAHAVLEATIVSGVRVEQHEPNTPASISVINRQQIEASGASHIVQVLRGLGGIQLLEPYGDGSRASISMRGFGETAHGNTLILVDGRRLNNTDIAAPDLNSVKLADVERIEVVQGSAGVLFGDQAVGGVINIITRDATRASAGVDVAAGSFGQRSVQLSASTGGGHGPGASLFAQRREADNYRDHNALEYSNARGRLQHRHGRGLVFAELQLIDDELETPGSLFADELAADRRQVNPTFAGDFSNIETRVIRAGLEHAFMDDWMLQGEINRRDSDGVFRLSFATLGPETENASQDRQVQQFTPRVSGRIEALLDSQVTAGVDITRSEYRLASRLGAQSNDQDIVSPYLQLVTPLTASLDITSGVRLARVENVITDGFSFNGDEINDRQKAFTLGMSWRIDPSLRLLLRLDRNFRFAKVDEYTNATPFLAPTVILETQQGRSYEAGIEWQAASNSGKLLLYRLELDNEIAFDPVNFVNLNLDESRRSGVIFESRYPVDDGTTLVVNYTFTDASFDDSVLGGNDVPYVAEHSGSIALDRSLWDRWSLWIELQAVSDRVLSGDFDNALRRLPGYGMVNMSLRYDRGKLRLSARVDNLLDREVSEFGVSALAPVTFSQTEAYFPSPQRRLLLQASWLFH